MFNRKKKKSKEEVIKETMEQYKILEFMQNEAQRRTTEELLNRQVKRGVIV